MQIGSLSLSDCSFAFQSQGVSGGSWLGPTVEETITGLQQQGHKGVFVQPIGFLCDHVEVLYDIDIAFKKFAEERGMRLWRADRDDADWLARRLDRASRPLGASIVLAQDDSLSLRAGG
jgi:protoheme ferro-lyase